MSVLQSPWWRWTGFLRILGRRHRWNGDRTGMVRQKGGSHDGWRLWVLIGVRLGTTKWPNLVFTIEDPVTVHPLPSVLLSLFLACQNLHRFIESKSPNISVVFSPENEIELKFSSSVTRNFETIARFTYQYFEHVLALNVWVHFNIVTK